MYINSKKITYYVITVIAFMVLAYSVGYGVGKRVTLKEANKVIGSWRNTVDDQRLRIDTLQTALMVERGQLIGYSHFKCEGHHE